ncbi:MAG: hypothetical protein RLZZ596_1833 [Pseudomonadota bacterium]|jgi:uncharacterized heparinase superfamily protein
MLSPTRFRFLNEERTVEAARDWDPPQSSILWIYNLHYFDDLNAIAAKQRTGWHRALIHRWIAENPPGSGPGWEPYPLSLRIVNWIKWALAGNVLDDDSRHSLAVQVRYLAGRLEYHLLGNHLFANAKALVFAGCYFDGDEAARWMRCGMNVLAQQIPEQILADGGHFERSTMYHALAYEDLLDLANVCAAFPQAITPWAVTVADWRTVIARMGRWLAAMCHPDGEISFFNDAATGIAPTPSELFTYARRLGHEVPAINEDVVWLDGAGYIRLQLGRAVMLIDVAPLGPDYLPAHGHADTLSFELSLDDQRVIVNSGTSRYGLGPEREWERSTAAHSTMEINGQNSSEVWSGFRVGRRARPFAVAIRKQGETITVEAAHDGYRRLSGRPVHQRVWSLGLGGLTISDKVVGRHLSSVARYYFHPSIAIQPQDGQGLLSSNGTTAGYIVDTGRAQLVKAYYASAFGVQVENNCLQLHGTDGRMALALHWS